MDKNQKIAVLIVNLGTPSSATYFGVWRYLAEFLSDKRVVEIPAILWLPLLYGLILPLRSRSSAKAYKKIWLKEGSPLLVYSQKIAEALASQLQQRVNSSIKVLLGMRYGKPSIAAQLSKLEAEKIDKLLIFPLYPQYSAAATASVYDAVGQALRTWRVVPELIMANQYASDPIYITAMFNHIKHYWQQQSSNEKLLFSFHGLPKRSIALGDPYYEQCNLTAKLIAEKLQLPRQAWQVVFQSRFGREEWLQPYCDKTLIDLAKQGCKQVDIVCPGFPADCLETLEEIAIRNKEIFLAAGGKELNYIPAFNAKADHIASLTEIITRHLNLTKEL